LTETAAAYRGAFDTRIGLHLLSFILNGNIPGIGITTVEKYARQFYRILQKSGG
jgi:hypothetical protein